MRRNSQNTNNRYYAYLPPTNSTASRNSSSNSTNRNTHYQYYDPRLRTQQQTQKTLYEYQYSSTSPNRSQHSLYGSPRHQHYYQPPSFLQELPSLSTNSVSDLGEPISIFDDIQPLEHRRSIVAPSLPSTYIPPDPSRRPSASDIRLATAHVLREQLLTDIEHSIDDIERDLTSLERRPSVARYIPPRFSPIIELDSQDENLFRQITSTIKPVSVPTKKSIPIITSPVHKQIQKTSAHSTTTTTKERTSGSSKNWPNKPKRVYEVIPSLTSDSRKTSRQSSIGGQNEHIKVNEIQSPQTPQKSIEKNIVSSSLPLRGQYHYGPEVEEIEILSNDPENIDQKSTFDEMRDASFYEILNTDQFLRDSSGLPQSRAMIFVPEYSGNSQMEEHELTEDLIQNDHIDTNIVRSSTASSIHDLTSTKELIIQDTESLIQTAPQIQIEPELKPRIASRSTISPHELYHKTETDLIIQNNPIITEPIKHSRPSTKDSIITPINNDNIREKSPSLQITTIDSTTSLPPPHPPVDSNVSGLVAYFFSDFGNEGEGEEDLIPIDQSNFVVPTGAEIIADDDISSSLMGQSQASLLILHSAHVPRQQQQQQQLTSPMPSTIENNNEYIKAEEKESKETDLTKKRIPTATSILLSSSPPPKQVLPTSIIDDMKTQFSRNNSINNDDQQRQPSTKTLNMNAIDSNIEQQEKRSNNSQSRLHSSSTSTPQMSSRIQSTTSERNDKKLKKNNEETRSISSRSHKSLKNIDREHTETTERYDSTDQKRKLSSRTLSRDQSMTSNHSKHNDGITPIDSPTRTSLKNIDRENSTSSRQTMSREPSITPSEKSHSSQQKFPPLRPSSITNHDINQSLNLLLRNQSTTPPDGDDDDDDDDDGDLHKTPINENEPNTFSAESEHFLHNKPQSPYNLNQRLPSGYSMSHPSESRRSSTASSALPVTLDSPDIDNNPPTTSRTATPMRKTSISSINAPPDPNILLTTTNEPDPDDPSIMNSTIHFQMLSSQHPNTDNDIPERDDPSPLVNIVPLQDYPTRVPSVELPAEEYLHLPSSTVHHSPPGKVILEPNDELPPVSPEIDVHIPSHSPFHDEQEEPSHRTPSPSKIEHHQVLSRQSPLLSYPARLEDLMRPTPSPFLSAHEHQKQQEQEQNDQLSPVPPPINETKQHDHYSIPQNLPSKFEHNDEHSPLSSPRRSPLSDTNHTSVEGDDTYRQQLDSPPMSLQNKRIISSQHSDNIDNNKNNHHHHHHHPYPTVTRTLIPSPPPPTDPTFITENRKHSSSETSVPPLPTQHDQRNDEHLYRNDVQLSSASIKFSKHHSSPPSSPSARPTSNDEHFPTMTPSQRHSKLSLRLRNQEPKRKKSITDQPSSPLPQIDTVDMTSTTNDDNLLIQKTKRRQQRRRVSFSSSIAHFQMEERQLLTNWRERVAAILASKHRPNEKYAHIQSRVNSFANFEYQPKKIKTISKKIFQPKINNEQTNIEESKFIKRKKFKVKKPKLRRETYDEEQTDDEQQNQSAKDAAPQIFGRLWCQPDGSPTVFHESLDWNVSSKLKGYSYENLNYEPLRNEFKIFNKKPKWHSESKLAEIIKESPRVLQRQRHIPTNSLSMMSGRGEPYFYQQQPHEIPGTEKKIFDIQTNIHQQSEPRLQQHFSDNMSHRSYGSRPSDIPIFSEKLIWTGKSKLKDTTWKNLNYQRKKSKVQIFHKSVHWNSEPKIRTRSPSTIHPSRASMSNVHIFDEKLNWDAQAKVHCWSEIDLRQLTKRRAIFSQYHDPKWNDIVTARIDATNYNYPKLSNHVEIFSDRLTWRKDSELKDYVWENFDYKTHRQTRQSNNQKNSQDIDQTPPNRPKWNAVSKTRSVNSVYNPKITNSNTIRRGWDRELRRKRVHKLPPLKRKREHEELPQLALDVPSSTLASTGQLALDYNYDHSSTTQGRTTSNGYATTSSRRSSKALVPINHNRPFFELELPTETPRSQRPVQQEWYDEMNKSRLTQRTDMGRNTNHSFRNSIDSIHKPNTPRELVTFRSSTRNSQNSVMSGTLLDSSIRTNRATEFRLAKDMDEHHHHSHTPSQSMPIEIRGFQLEGTPLSVPDHATIRPLSNVNYGGSERVKSRRVYPWSNLHPHGTSSRNSSLVPIAEFRRPSLDTTIIEAQQLIHEE